MKTLSYFIYIQLMLCSNDALDQNNAFRSWTAQKIQGIQNTVHKLGCQRHVSDEYSYLTYAIEGLELDNVVVKKTQGELTYFEIHLAIKAPYGSIILSPIKSPFDAMEKTVFEIGIGVNANNEYTALSLMPSDGDDTQVVSVKTPNLISTNRYTDFYLKISKDKLTFGIEDDAPLITYSDSKLRNVKYFGFSSLGETLWEVPLRLSSSQRDVLLLQGQLTEDKRRSCVYAFMRECDDKAAFQPRKYQ